VSASAVDISHDRLHVDDLTPGVANIAQVVGGLGLVAAVVMGLIGTGGSESFLRAYIANYGFFLTIMLGALFFVILQHLTRAGWSVTVRRLAENVSAVAPLMAILSLPIVIPIMTGWPESIHRVYPWTDAEHVAHSKLLSGKTAYLNTTFFAIRMVIYFAAWILMTSYFRNASIRQDETADPQITLRMQTLSAPAMLVFALTLTFGSVDLIMTLNPEWFSTIFGVYVFAGGNVAFFATLVLVMQWLQSRGRLSASLTTEHFHDVGKLMFAFVVFWAYIGFSQYMLIWYASLPEEVIFYWIRHKEPWLWLSLILLFGHFVAPFLGLISRVPKRTPGLLIIGAVWLLAMHWLDHIWLVLPRAVGTPNLDGPPSEHAVTVAGLTGWDVLQCLLCLIGIGGLFVAGVARKMGQASLIPRKDPRLGESLAFENI